MHNETVPDGFTVAMCSEANRYYLHNEETGDMRWMRRANRRVSGTEERLSVNGLGAFQVEAG